MVAASVASATAQNPMLRWTPRQWTNFAVLEARGVTNGLGGGGVAQTNISYTAVTNAPWQWGSANLTNWSAVSVFNTNGLAGTNYVNTATNGFVTAAVTNGLAGTNYVNTATNGFVTAAVTNGLAGPLGYTPQPADADLTNWAALATSAKQDALGFSPQIASANLTNWSALATSAKQDALGYTPQPADADLTNWAGVAATAAGVQGLFPGTLHTNGMSVAATFSNSVAHSALAWSYHSNITAGRFVVHTVAGGLTNIGLSAAAPINQDQSATTFAQIQALAPETIQTNGSTLSYSNNSFIVASNGFYFPTNYVSSKFAVQQRASFLIVSNNYLYFVTKTKTNLIVNGN